MDGREECRILAECWKEKRIDTEKKREKYYQRNGEGRESENPGRMRGV
jgi:hypothetical protein